MEDHRFYWVGRFSERIAMLHRKPRVLILGGGFGGMYAALEFERALARGADADVTLVNRDNFFLFTPMLHEVRQATSISPISSARSASCCVA